MGVTVGAVGALATDRLPKAAVGATTFVDADARDGSFTVFMKVSVHTRLKMQP